MLHLAYLWRAKLRVSEKLPALGNMYARKQISKHRLFLSRAQDVAIDPPLQSPQRV